MTTAAAELDAIEGRAEAATEGPWAADGWEISTVDVPATSAHRREYAERIAEVWPLADAAFIAHARTDVPAMAKALRDVLVLHRTASTPFGLVCLGCDEFPCPTVTAITAALSVSEEGK